MQLTLVERFIALPAPQDSLRTPFIHFNLDRDVQYSVESETESL